MIRVEKPREIDILKSLIGVYGLITGNQRSFGLHIVSTAARIQTSNQHHT